MKGTQGTGEKILVVDDEPIICNFVSELLSGFADVITSQKLEEAKELLSQKEFKLAIFDLSLSGRQGNEGFELLKYVRATSPKTKVVIMTGVGTDDVRDEAFALGAEHFLCKPFSVDRLLSEIRRYF